jgi:hypothetical protein
MGYCTEYELEVINGDNALIAKLIEENQHAAYALYANGDTKEQCKWYEHKSHLREFSRKHPEALLRLNGVGEGSGDIWSEYYRNGKMQVCNAKLVMPDFDDRLLK